jgi:DNA polymerase-1
MPRYILVDGDILVYQQASIHQQSIDWGDGVQSVNTSDGQARKAVLDQVLVFQDKLKADKVIVCLSDPKRNWRKQIMPTYKANRKGYERPLLYDEMRSTLTQAFKTMCYPWLEADDLLGLLTTDSKLLSGDKIVVSVDKDLKTVPGKLYNPKKDELGVQVITPEEAQFNHLKQVLMGDPVDGYHGVKGIGPKKAEKILTEAGPALTDQWKAILMTYREAGLKLEDALVTARVARIIRKGEYDLQKRRVNLWTPPKFS